MSASLGIVLVALVGQSNAKTHFDASLRAHTALKRASVTVVNTTRVGKNTVASRFEVNYVRPSSLSIRVRQGESDRTYYILDRRFIGYDRKQNEYLERTAPKNLTLLERAVFMLGTLDDSVQTVIEPAVTQGFYDKFSSLKGWSITSGSAVNLSLRRGSGNQRSTTTFALGQQSRLLERVRIEGAVGSLDWRYMYNRAPSRIAFVPPKGALKVSSFLAADPSIKFLSAKAKGVFEGAARAHDGLRNVEMIVRTAQGTSRIWRKGNLIREDQANVSWSFRSGVLTVVDPRTKRLYRGKTTFASVPTFLQRLLRRMDPAVAQFFTRRNAVRVLAGPKASVNWVGTITDRGVVCDLLQISERSLKATAWIRQKDGLLHRAEAQIVDAKGATVSTSERSFEYVRIGGVPDSVFDLGKGAAALGLKQIRR